MSEEFNARIDGIPVRIKIVSAGPAPKKHINKMKKNLLQEIERDGKMNKPQNTRSQPSTQAPSNQPKPSLPSEGEDFNFDEMEGAVEEIEQAFQQTTPEKPWWTSRTIITNICFVIVGIASAFGFGIPMTPEMVTAIVSLMGLINIFLRNITKQPINKKLVIPRF